MLKPGSWMQHERAAARFEVSAAVTSIRECSSPSSMLHTIVDERIACDDFASSDRKSVV